MKTQTTKIKLILAFCLFLLAPLGLFAAPLAYVCGSGTVTLKYTGPYALMTDDQVVWQEVSADGSTTIGAPIVNTYNGTAGSADLVLTGGGNLASVGEHFYKMHVLTNTPGGCTGDVSDAVSIYLLPGFSVALTPTTTTYCEAGGTNTAPSVITALATPASGLPTGVKFVYDWTGSTGGSASGTDNNTYTMATTTVGTYPLTAKATFDTGAIPLKSAAGAGCEESGTTTITVSAKPGKPTIQI